MRNKIIGLMLGALIRALPQDVMKRGVDALLDVIEDAVGKSETTFDDHVVLPVIKLIRQSFDIPDND